MASICFSPCALGVEDALADELRAVGATDLRIQRGGIEYQADREVLYRANLWLRTAIRVQERIAEFEAESSEALYEAASRIDWSRFLLVDQTLAIDASVHSERFRHSGYAAQVTKDAIVDQFREKHGSRPSVDRKRPVLPLKLVIQDTRVLLYRNYSGRSLHKRGWRPIQVKSPLNEATAAGLLLLSDWDRESPLVDPMCGSGTFVIEAALIAARMPPGGKRRFAFEFWPDFDADLWQRIRDESRSGQRDSLDFDLEGADSHRGAIQLARQGAQRAGVDRLVRFHERSMASYTPSANGTIIVNPPYGKRIAAGREAVDAWRQLGRFLHQRGKGTVAWVLCGNRELTRHLGLRSDRKLRVSNGSIDCRFLRYEVSDRSGSEPRHESRPEPKPRRTSHECHDTERPSPWVQRHLGEIKSGGTVLDLACGSGRHTRLLLDAGHPVVAVDLSLDALAPHTLPREHRQRLEAIAANLEDGSPWPVGDRKFAGIVVTNYLFRPLFPRIIESLEPGGVVIYETFMNGHEKFGKPTNPAFLLRPHELLEAFSGLWIIAFEQRELKNPRPSVVQRICARNSSSRGS